MRVLLDTHCWLWMQVAPEKFSREALQVLEYTGNELFLSAVSAWEISIKYEQGKLPLPMPPREYLQSRMQSSDIKMLSISHLHASQVNELPGYHHDIFDRLLIVQANVENLKMMTADARFADYDVEVIAAV